MIENRQHWLTKAINESRPGTLPPDALPSSANSMSAWRMLRQNFGLTYLFIAEAVANTLGLPIVDTRSLKQHGNNLLPEQFCRKLGIFPYDLESERPVIATCDPRLTPDHRQQIRFMLGRDFDLAIVSPDDLDTTDLLVLAGCLGDRAKSVMPWLMDILHSPEAPPAAIREQIERLRAQLDALQTGEPLRKR